MTPPVADPTPATRPRRRWLRLSLRATMILILLVGTALGWLVNRVQAQRRGIAAVVARGGRITYDWAMRDDKAGQRPLKEPPGPRWLRGVVGDEFFQEVGYVRINQPAPPADLALLGDFGRLRGLGLGDVSQIGAGLRVLAGMGSFRSLTISGPGLTDASLAPVGELTGLDLLWVEQGDITDQGLNPLANLAKLTKLDLRNCSRLTSAGVARLIERLPLLETLELAGTPVDDAVLPAVAGLRALKTLSLERTGVTDVGLVQLAGLTQLETLLLRYDAIGDAGLAPLAGLTRMKSLTLDQTQVTGAGLAALTRMTALTDLRLSGTAIDDSGLQSLASLRELMFLNLSLTRITDASMPVLAGLPKLNQLFLSNTRISDAGVVLLTKLPMLGNLTVGKTGVTAAGEAEFRRLRGRPIGMLQRVPTLTRTRTSPRPLGPGEVGAPRGIAATTPTPAQPLRPDPGATSSASQAPSQGKTVASTNPSVLDRLRDQHRPVLVFASSIEDPKFTRQRHSWVGPLPEAGIKDRDIVIVEVMGQQGSRAGTEPMTPEEAQVLRQTFRVNELTFAVVLVGRDGTEKARWAEPVSPQEIFGKIDAMPMRQEEVQARGGGHE